MTSFAYRAVGSDGKLLQGELDAPDVAHAAGVLQARGATPLRIRPIQASSLHNWLSTLSGSTRVSHTALVEFLQRLATLLNGGVAVEDALAVLANRSGATRAQQLANDLLDDLREGSRLADAMAVPSRGLPPIAIGMVRAGELSGALPDTLARLADYMQRDEASRQALRSALIYPTILLITASFSILTVLVVVLPALRPAIMGSGAPLPLVTRVAYYASDAVSMYWWVVPIVVVSMAWSIRFLASDRALIVRWSGALLRLPVIGHVIQQSEVARFARTLGVLVDGGVALPTAIGLAHPVVSNVVMSDAVKQVALRLREGEGLAEPLAQTGLFPDLCVQLVRIGEVTGRLGMLLLQLADICEIEVRRTTERSLAVLVPALTIGLGVFVAAIVASVVLALLNVNDLIR